MKLLMENWRKYLDQITEEDIASVSNNIFIFENNVRSTCSFDSLMERYDRKELTVEQISEVWEKSILYEMEQLAILEESVLDWTKEKLASVSDEMRSKWAASLQALMKQAASFIVKLLKQSMAFAAKFFNKLKGVYDDVGRRGYIAAMNIARKLIRGGFKVAKILGPFVIIVGCVMVVSIAFGGTAHAAAGGNAADPELNKVASEILFETFQSLGGLEALDPDVIETYQNVVHADGELARVVSDVTMEMGMSVANQEVDALKTITNALHQKVTVDGKLLNLQEIMEHYNNANVNEKIQLALEASADLKTLDPEAYQELLETANNNPLDIGWFGNVKADISTHQSVQTVGDVVKGAGTATNKIKSAGFDIPVRTK